MRFSLDNLKLDDDMLNIPLFMADQTDQLIGMALEGIGGFLNIGGNENDRQYLCPMRLL